MSMTHRWATFGTESPKGLPLSNYHRIGNAPSAVHPKVILSPHNNRQPPPLLGVAVVIKQAVDANRLPSI